MLGLPYYLYYTSFLFSTVNQSGEIHNLDARNNSLVGNYPFITILNNLKFSFLGIIVNSPMICVCEISDII